jgi:hypothetical protein
MNRRRRRHFTMILRYGQRTTAGRSGLAASASLAVSRFQGAGAGGCQSAAPVLSIAEMNGSDVKDSPSAGGRAGVAAPTHLSASHHWDEQR